MISCNAIKLEHVAMSITIELHYTIGLLVGNQPNILVSVIGYTKLAWTGPYNLTTINQVYSEQIFPQICSVAFSLISLCSQNIHVCIHK